MDSNTHFTPSQQPIHVAINAPSQLQQMVQDIIAHHVVQLKDSIDLDTAMKIYEIIVTAMEIC